MSDERSTTRLLLDGCEEGDPAAAPALFALLQAELRRLAARAMAGERRNHTLQPTALVNEAWIRLVGNHPAQHTDRQHFLAAAATAMRSVLTDHARRRRALKRGAGKAEPLDDEVLRYEEEGYDLVELDDALERLSERSPLRTRLVELRFFAGLTIAEAATALGVGTATVEREWRLARVYLRERMGPR